MEEKPGIEREIELNRFIEDIGLFFEKMGLPRMAGRILGVLLICEPPEQSITEIGQRLNASKSSISIMTRLLLENGLIERAPSPLPRQDYYRFKPGGWIVYMRQWLETMSALHAITERGMVLLDDNSPGARENLMEAHDLFSMMEEELPAMLAKMEEERRRRG